MAQCMGRATLVPYIPALQKHATLQSILSASGGCQTLFWVPVEIARRLTVKLRSQKKEANKSCQASGKGREFGFK